MIRFQETDLHDQAGMERAMRDYETQLVRESDGTMNTMLDAKLVSCDFEKRMLVEEFAVQRWMSNPNGFLHGGVTAAMLDMVMGILSRYCSGGGMTPTVTLEVTYLHPIPVGSTLCVEAACTMSGSTVCAVNGIAWIREKGRTEPAATAAAAYHVSRAMRMKKAVGGGVSSG